MSNVILVLSTWPEEAAVEKIAEGVVEAGLAACVNCIPQVHSIFRWQGKTEQAREQLLLLKTTAGRLPELQAYLEKRHPYTTPEIIAVAVTDGLADYLDWVRESVS